MIQAHPPDAATACRLGAAQQAAICLASTDDDTWQAALLLIQQLTQNAETFGQLKQVSHRLSHNMLPDLGPCKLTHFLRPHGACCASVSWMDYRYTVEAHVL